MLGAALGGLAPAWVATRRRAAAWPHWVWPLAVCAIFSAAGILVLDDYSVTSDTVLHQRPLAIGVVDFALGDVNALPADYNKFYGAAFETLPLLVERIAGLDDLRAIYLTRHLMTHLFFLAGGFCCYLLAYRMTGSRLLGLFAMLLFLLHPRMYGHSFWNSKDIPFLSMFIIALLGIHWAFRSGAVAAFVLCGIVIGILVNLRIMGIMLLPAVLAMRACDLYFAGNWAERRQVISSGAAFALAAIVIYYASMPYLWADPLGRFGELLATLSSPTFKPYELFQGRYVASADLPALYLPVWIGITTPPWALLLAGLGAVGIAWRAVRRAGAWLRNGGLRFELLLVVCAALPVIAVIALQLVVHSDWRQLYFLWAPLCLLAMLGLRQVGAVLGETLTPRPATLARWALAGLAAIALASVVVQSIRLHPYQQLYFNFLVDRTTPEYLKTQYDMDYSHTGRLEGYQYLLDNHPGETIQLEWRSPTVRSNWRYLETFSDAERRRFRFAPATDADYYMINPVGWELNAPELPPLLPPAIYDIAVYHNTIMSVATPDLSRVEPAVADAYRAIYRAATAHQEPALRADFDFYLNDRTLTLVNEDCPPGVLNRPYWLRVYPLNPDRLPAMRRTSRHIPVRLYGVRLDGKCLMQATLPDYDIARITVSRVGEILTDDYLTQLRRQYAALQEMEPAIRSDFAVYAEADALRYLKSECRPDATAPPFYLHLIPAAADSLPDSRRQYGYDNRDFEWDDLAVRGRAIAFDDKCMATVELPDYAIHGVRTGQHMPGGGRLWSGEFYTAAGIADRASRLSAQAVGTPAATSFFSVYHGAGALTYIREDCAPGDTAAAFYLHLIPSDADDLPAGRREHGFDNRDFEFAPAGGVQYAGRCLASIPLPDYPIDRIHTGQYSPETGRLWAAEFAVAVGLSGGQ